MICFFFPSRMCLFCDFIATELLLASSLWKMVGKAVKVMKKEILFKKNCGDALVGEYKTIISFY